jgi:hypothetical protein
MRINILALAGAVIGAVALFSTWESVLYRDLNLPDVLTRYSYEDFAYWSAIVIVIGVLVSFITSLGSVVEVLGVVMWWADTLNLQGDIPTRPGSYIVMASAIILALSMIRPLGPGLLKGPFSLKDRLLNFGPTRGSPPREASGDSTSD